MTLSEILMETDSQTKDVLILILIVLAIIACIVFIVGRFR